MVPVAGHAENRKLAVSVCSVKKNSKLTENVAGKAEGR